MHTAQAAERQVNQLCKESGLPTPAPPTPAPDSSLESDSDSALCPPRSALDTLPELPVLPHPDEINDPEYVPDIRRLAGYIELLHKHVKATLRPLPPMHPKAFDMCPELRHLLRPPPT